MTYYTYRILYANPEEQIYTGLSYDDCVLSTGNYLYKTRSEAERQALKAIKEEIKLRSEDIEDDCIPTENDFQYEILEFDTKED